MDSVLLLPAMTEAAWLAVLPNLPESTEKTLEVLNIAVAAAAERQQEALSWASVLAQTAGENAARPRGHGDLDRRVVQYSVLSAWSARKHLRGGIVGTRQRPVCTWTGDCTCWSAVRVCDRNVDGKEVSKVDLKQALHNSSVRASSVQVAAGTAALMEVVINDIDVQKLFAIMMERQTQTKDHSMYAGTATLRRLVQHD